MKLSAAICFALLGPIGGCPLLNSDAAGDEPPVSCADLAQAFNFPPDLLVASNLTEQARSAHGAGVIEAWEYSSTGHTFAPISLLVARGGMIVTENFSREAEELLARMPTPTAIRRISIGPDSLGYSYGAAGPGGSETILALNLPSANIDLQIKLSG